MDWLPRPQRARLDQTFANRPTGESRAADHHSSPGTRTTEIRRGADLGRHYEATISPPSPRQHQAAAAQASTSRPGWAELAGRAECSAYHGQSIVRYQACKPDGMPRIIRVAGERRIEVS